MKDTRNDVLVPLMLFFQRIDRPRALNIEVIITASHVHDDLVRFDLASRPFIRDLVSNRLVTFWELLRPRGTCLVLRDQESHQSIEQIAINEVRFISDELMRRRRIPSLIAS